ncbi:unnamed protein product [Paramecium sonneborni]|uniref:CBM20 domain-containing protein n=1 Tax=Paramecium sonneborni TaxID=65129 RepID=A0A8S1R688_9CILI|nr:unnamed protein product [Paramecium sonneborni]
MEQQSLRLLIQVDSRIKLILNSQSHLIKFINNLFSMPFILFNVEITLKYGQALYLANSQCNWIVDKICRMICIQDSLWQLSFEVSQKPFEYKYVIGDYFLSNESYFQWEQGPNRILNWKDEKSMNIKNRWEERKIQFILESDPKISVAILMSNYNKIQKRLKNYKDKNNHQKVFYTSIYADVNKMAEGIEVQYYLLLQGKNPCELISKPFTLDLSEQYSFDSKELEFSKLSL